ncbi:MAG TPA: NUDIX domain-containing protein, partial [Vicinamibacteria bacterium]|nr:NUDIX domain-containing protein [Vicinamibacteria bacterium]
VVVPYYEAFLRRFPTVRDLALASEEDVLALWSGLGYYHRARNLRRGARHLMAQQDGRFPKTLEAALGVPGVGLYTASAVLSIASGLPLPVVDGNVRRVLARLLALAGPEWNTDGPYYNRAGEFLDPEQPGAFNQAVMELGATLCRPRRPACPVCPLRRQCRAHAAGMPESYPEPRRRRPTVDVTVAAALLERAGRVLLVKRKEGRLMGRLWEVPQTSLESRGRADLVKELREIHGLEIVAGPLAVRARHAITHRRILLEGYRARLKRLPPEDQERFLWVAPSEISKLPVGSITRKMLKGLREPQMPLPLA